MKKLKIIQIIPLILLILFVITISSKRTNSIVVESDIKTVAIDTTRKEKIEIKTKAKKDTFNVKQQMLEKRIVKQNSKLDSIIKKKK